MKNRTKVSALGASVLLPPCSVLQASCAGEADDTISLQGATATKQAPDASGKPIPKSGPDSPVAKAGKQ